MPQLTPAQIREGSGILLLFLGLLSLLAMVYAGGPVLTNLRHLLFAGFGYGWLLPTVGLLALSVYLIWPHPPPVGPLPPLAAGAAALACLGLLSLASAPAGGAAGRLIERPLSSLGGGPGALLLLLLALLLGLVLAFRLSPGNIMLAAARGGRRAYAERRRLEELVARSQAAAKRAPKKATTPALVTAAEPNLEEILRPLPEADWRPAATGAAATLPGPPFVQPGQERAGEPLALRVVAEPEDELPEIDWKLPPLTLLDTLVARKERMQEEIKRNVRLIEGTLATFGVQARVIGVNSGPAVTQYELQPAAGVAVKRIVALQNDLSLALAAAPLRIEAPIPGKSAVGLEVPNRSASLVSLREVVESPAFAAGSHQMALALGNDVSGQPITGDLTRLPHLLIAGATGQGKSVCINVLITSLLLRCTPERLRLVMIDPKRVELSGYNGLPHLAVPVIVESHQAAAALRWAVAEMDRRYKLLSAQGMRNIGAYNDRAAQQHARPLPYVVIVIDELADLMMVAAGEIEELICRIAQLARAVGIHLIIATQRPSTDIITGLIKANVPSRIAFAVSSQVDSRVILDSVGAEKLLGRGDMLYQPVDAGKPTRIQGAFLSDQELESVIGFWQAQGEPRFIEEVLEGGAAPPLPGEGESGRRLDPLFARAARAVAAEGGASVSLVQRKFNVGYSRAGRIVDQLAEHRVIGAYQGSKSREVLMNLPDVDELLERIGLEG
ncbi:MAG: DNA translocase FtsK [Candidatus Dormibacter sp.]|uniref:DNA translocase FtsK n=1 Tax=Candidatus Dormibacter sp. TaxID=2973982 RepID=UPI0026ADFF6C